MIIHILSNFSGAYQNTEEILENNSYNDSNTLIIEKIRDMLSVKYNQMNNKNKWKRQEEVKNRLT